MDRSKCLDDIGGILENGKAHVISLSTTLTNESEGCYMSEQWDNDEITEALHELISSLGVKEDGDIHSLEILFRKGHLQQCVQEIATQLRLPNRINLSYVEAFSSVARAETGRVEPQNTAAQVLVPADPD
jgi:hypothetical protein